MTEALHDVVVIGGGPAGLAAACEAADTGASVALLEASPWLGGQIWKDTAEHPAAGHGRRWLDRLRAGGTQVHLDTRVVAVSAPRVLLTETPQGARHFRWKTLIIATGAREQFLPFPGWTLPGVAGAGGLQALVKSGWPVAGARVVVAGSGPLLLAVAAELAKQKAHSITLVEQAGWRGVRSFGVALAMHPGKIAQGLGMLRHLRRTRQLQGWWPTRAEGDGALQRVHVTNGSVTRTLPCDLLACAFGLVPNLELPRLLGLACSQDTVIVNQERESSQPGIYAIGELTGVAGVDGAITDGRIAGRCAVGARHGMHRLFAARAGWDRFARRLAHAYALRPELRSLATDDTIICRCEDVTLGELKPRKSSREARLQCRCGMGHCQGRVCGDITRVLFGWDPGSMRPPLLPVRIETLHASLDPGGPHDI